MGKINKHPPVKLIAGLIFREQDILNAAQACLRKRFGKIDFESQALAFNHTDYYQEEFGDNLLRKFVSFKKPADPQALAEIKIFTNKIEQGLSKHGCRRINIDPGYLNLSKLILATTKDYSHRIYLKKGIYAEVALFYQDKSFKPWPFNCNPKKTPANRKNFLQGIIFI